MRRTQVLVVFLFGLGVAVVAIAIVYSRRGNPNDVPFTPRPVMAIKHRQGFQFAIAVSPDEKYVACATRINGGEPSTEIVIWDWRKDQQLSVIQQADAVHGLAFSPDGNWLAGAVYGDAHGFVRIWETRSWSARHTLRFRSHNPTCVRFSHDGRFVASGGTDGELVVWNSALAAVASTLPGHDAGVAGLDFSSNRRDLISVGRRGPLFLWDVRSWIAKRTIPWMSTIVDSPVGYNAVAFAPDSSSFATVGPDRILRIWATGATAAQAVCVRLQHTPLTLTYLADGQMLAVGCGDSYNGSGTVEFIDTVSGKRIRSAICADGRVFLLQYIPRNHCLAVGTQSPTASVEIWDLADLDL